MDNASDLLRQARAQGIVYIDPRIDYAFKLIFGTPGNEDLLLRLVQAILPDKGIISVSLVPQEQVGLRPDARKSVVDVRCHTDDNSELIIEMQIKSQNDFSDRMVFYSSFPIINRLVRGDNSSFKLTPLYMVGITDFIIPGVLANDDMINHYTIRNIKDNGIEFTDSIHYVTVELPKLTKTLAEVKDTSDWILFTIKNIGSMKEMPKEYRGSYLERFFELSKFAAMEEMSQREYLARYMWEVDQRSQLRSAREDGLAEGIAIGQVEGRVETARRMLAKGFPLETISELTSLSVEEICELS